MTGERHRTPRTGRRDRRSRSTRRWEICSPASTHDSGSEEPRSEDEGTLATKIGHRLTGPDGRLGRDAPCFRQALASTEASEGRSQTGCAPKQREPAATRKNRRCRACAVEAGGARRRAGVTGPADGNSEKADSDLLSLKTSAFDQRPRRRRPGYARGRRMPSSSRARVLRPMRRFTRPRCARGQGQRDDRRR